LTLDPYPAARNFVMIN